MSSKIAFNTNLPEPIRTRADFTYNITPGDDLNYRYRPGQMPGDRGYRGGLAKNRILAPGFNREVQDHVPRRQRILASRSTGRQNGVFTCSAANRLCEKPARSCLPKRTNRARGTTNPKKETLLPPRWEHC